MTKRFEPEIVAAANHVIIDGQFVQRKAHVSPSQWLAYWTRLVNHQRHHRDEDVDE